MKGVLLDLGPARGTLLLPDDDLAIIRARCEVIPILGVRPSDLPHRSSMPAQSNNYEFDAARDSKWSTHPFRVCPEPRGSLSTTSKTRTVRSEEQVASRFP